MIFDFSWRPKGEPIEVGDRITLTGGYFPNPEWLQERTHHLATVLAFIPGQNDTPALVARLDTPIEVEGHRGDIAVMELRYVGAEWRDECVAHIELLDEVPEDVPFPERTRGYWVESHATVLKGERA